MTSKSNWFEESPARSVVIHTLVVGGAVWAAFAFVFDENKVNAVRAQVENEKAIASQYKAKTEVLEVEVARLRDENKKYETWLTTTPTSIPFLEAKIKTLTDENNRLQQEHSEPRPTDSAPLSSEQPGAPYAASKTLSLGEAYVDQKTGATIGIGKISDNFTATGNITLPGQKPQIIEKIIAGNNWFFTHSGQKYQLIVLKVDWFSNKAEVSVREVPSDK